MKLSSDVKKYLISNTRYRRPLRIAPTHTFACAFFFTAKESHLGRGIHVGEIYSSARPLKSRLYSPISHPFRAAPTYIHVLAHIITLTTTTIADVGVPFRPLQRPLSLLSPHIRGICRLLPGTAVHILFSKPAALTICSGVM